MPDYKDYIQNVYTALKTKVQGFDRTPEEFQKLIRSNTQYRQNVYNALSERVQGFNRSTEEFDSLVGAESPIPKAANKVTSLPTFQEQQRQLVNLDKTKFDKAAERDNASWSAAFKTAYNGLIPGLIERGVGAAIELAPSPYALPQELVRAQKRKAKEDVASVVSTIKAEVTPEEQAALQFDVTKNSVGQNTKALVSMSGQLIGDISLGASTGGASFFALGFNDGVNEYDEAIKRSGGVPNEGGRMAFGFVNGAVNGLLESFALNKIFGTGPALKNLQRKVVAEVFDETLKKGGKFTTKELEQLAESKIRTLAKNVRTRGVKTLYGSSVEGATEGIQSALTDAAKVITNKAERREVFDDVDMQDIAKNFVNNTAAGFIFGAPMGISSTLNTHVDNQLLKDISNAKTEDDFSRISSDLSATLDKQNYTPEHKQAILNKMMEYAEVKQSIPSYTPASAQEKAIPKILQRRDIDKTISEKESSLEKLDESLKGDIELEISMLRDRRNFLNDQIREDVSEDKFDYYEENGKFFKRLGENNPEEISRNYFEMADVNQVQQKDKPVSTDKNIKPVIIVNGNEYTGVDHGEAMKKAIEAGENIPSPDTQEGEIWRQENGLFKDVFGKLNTRDESKKEYGVERSADIQKTIEVVEPTEEQIDKDVREKNFTTFTYEKESDIPAELQDKRITSRGSIDGKPFVRITLPKSEADYILAKAEQARAPKAEAAVVAEVTPEPVGLKMSTIKQYTKAEQDVIIDEIGTPISARQAAMKALVEGWRFGKKNFSKETGIRIPQKSWFLTEKGPNIESSAESIWENLPDDMQEMFEPQDIRNQLIEILQEFDSKEAIREGYIKEFAPKEMSEADYINWYERNKEELDPIETEWQDWMMEQGEAEIATELDESVINDLITKYEQESATKGEGAAERATTEAIERTLSDDAYEAARKLSDEGEFDDYNKWRDEQLKNEDAVNREYESSSTRDFESREDFLLRKYCK
jgi:hypothetical protein